MNERLDLLDEARNLTAGNRNEAYGDPVLNHKHVADIFNAITGRDLSAREIVLVHEATKLARRARNPGHRDSYVDAMAYAGIEYECALAELAKAAASAPRAGTLRNDALSALFKQDRKE